MTTPTLHYHPLSSYCHKVLIAIDHLGADVDRRVMNPGDPQERSAFLALWPTGKIPLLVDGGRPVPETSVIIEHLQRHHAGPGLSLIPDDVDEALEVRLWDRVFDNYVMTPMQAFTNDLMRPEGKKDPESLVRARENLLTAYAMIERQLEGRTWIAGKAFSMADCAAAPSLFYAVTYVPLLPEHARLSAYFDRLMDHPPVARAVDQARPYFKMFPGRAGLSRRFYDPASEQ
jgi:glutathione S-transferase